MLSLSGNGSAQEDIFLATKFCVSVFALFGRVKQRHLDIFQSTTPQTEHKVERRAPCGCCNLTTSVHSPAASPRK